MENQYGWDFAFLSANLNYFMPELGWQSHPDIYLQWLDYHRPKSIHAPANWDVTYLQQLKTQPALIVCLYHLGYHAQIPRILADHDLPFDMILDRKVYDGQQEELKDMQAEMQRRGITYRFLFSEDPSVLLKARTALRKGRHLLVFADGHSGAADKQNRVRIDFLASKMDVRKGIALLSFLLKAPIIPLSHTETDVGITLFAGNTIRPESYSDREQYIAFAMRSLYQFLEQELYAAPHRWEAWNYLQELDCFEIVTKPDVAPRERANSPEPLLRLALRGMKGFFDRINYRFISD